MDRRKPIHTPIYQTGNDPVIVFLTVCTDRRKRILTNAEAVRVVTDAWEKADRWAVGRYVFMPDHIHLFCGPACAEPIELKKWVTFWKSLSSRSWTRRLDHPVWQPDFWDSKVRRGESYEEKWRYVVNNPVRKGLVARSEDWPYQGELVRFGW